MSSANADGIIARVCDLSAHPEVNVLDISQTIIDGFFNMMMIVDYSNADEEFGTVVDDLDKLGEEIGVRIRCQREEIFTKMTASDRGKRKSCKQPKPRIVPIVTKPC